MNQTKTLAKVLTIAVLFLSMGCAPHKDGPAALPDTSSPVPKSDFSGGNGGGYNGPTFSTVSIPEEYEVEEDPMEKISMSYANCTVFGENTLGLTSVYEKVFWQIFGSNVSMRLAYKFDKKGNYIGLKDLTEAQKIGKLRFSTLSLEDFKSEEKLKKTFESRLEEFKKLELPLAKNENSTGSVFWEIKENATTSTFLWAPQALISPTMMSKPIMIPDYDELGNVPTLANLDKILNGPIYKEAIFMAPKVLNPELRLLNIFQRNQQTEIIFNQVALMECLQGEYQRLMIQGLRKETP